MLKKKTENSFYRYQKYFLNIMNFGFVSIVFRIYNTECIPLKNDISYNTAVLI